MEHEGKGTVNTVLMVVGKGVMAGFMASMALAFLSLPLGLLLFVLGIPFIQVIVEGGLLTMRTYLLYLVLVCIIVGISYFTSKELARKKAARPQSQK